MIFGACEILVCDCATIMDVYRGLNCSHTWIPNLANQVVGQLVKAGV